MLGAIIARPTGQHWPGQLEREFFSAAPEGAGGGALSLVAYFPDDSLAIVLLANAEPVDLDRVEAAITAAW